jgi:hypothetical protein
MSNLTFTEPHNNVAFLEKSNESVDFTEIIDFLNASYIKFALTVKPTIYTSNIIQFWSSAKVKTINGEAQIHALVDGQMIIITEASIRRDLLLDDANGVENLPNTTIFEKLALMGYERYTDALKFQKGNFSPQWKFLIHTVLVCLSPKTTAWNEFSSNLASAIICLAENTQRFNFSKLIFDNMVKNLDGSLAKYFLYPRFLQLFLDNQFKKKKSHKNVYPTPCLTKKVFANMRRVGKDFSGRVTPLFPTMLALAQTQMGEGSAIPAGTHHTPTEQQQKTYKRRTNTKNTELPQASGSIPTVADEDVTGGESDMLARAATTVSSLAAAQDSGNIIKTRTKTTSNEESSSGTDSGEGPSHMETMGGSDVHPRGETELNFSSDPPLGLGNTSRSGEDSMQLLNELKDTCAKLSAQIGDLRAIASSQDGVIKAQGGEIKALKRRVRYLEGVKGSRIPKQKVKSSEASKDAPKQGGNEGKVSGEDKEGESICEESDPMEFLVADNQGNEAVMDRRLGKVTTVDSEPPIPASDPVIPASGPVIHSEPVIPAIPAIDKVSSLY